MNSCQELSTGVKCGESEHTYPLAGVGGEFLTVIVMVWLAKTLGGLERGNQGRWGGTGVGEALYVRDSQRKKP